MDVVGQLCVVVDGDHEKHSIELRSKTMCVPDVRYTRRASRGTGSVRSETNEEGMLLAENCRRGAAARDW
jgi:hypothetical protein